MTEKYYSKIIIRCFAYLCHRVQPQNAWSLDSWWISGRCRTPHGMPDSICLCCMLEPAVHMWLSPLVFLRFSWSALTTAIALKRWRLVLAECSGSDSPSWWEHFVLFQDWIHSNTRVRSFMFWRGKQGLWMRRTMLQSGMKLSTTLANLKCLFLSVKNVNKIFFP